MLGEAALIPSYELLKNQSHSTNARIHAASAVAVLVIPQLQEGAYGYTGARQLLGDRLTTSHVLDKIGRAHV